jgi:hypothetical protein
MASNEPADPFGPTDDAAVSIHHMYTSYVAVGFTKRQAMKLVCTVLKESYRHHYNHENDPDGD